MDLTTHRVVFLLACITYTSYGRRTQWYVHPRSFVGSAHLTKYRPNAMIKQLIRSVAGTMNSGGAVFEHEERKLRNYREDTGLSLHDEFLTLSGTREMVKGVDKSERSNGIDMESFFRLRSTNNEAPAFVFDVRSPGEFHQGHVPGSINLPLLNDEERAIVGTIYKQVGQSEAFDVALERSFPRLPNLLTQVAAVVGEPPVQSRTVLVYCKRGGMRSKSVALLLKRHGFDAYALEGGYRSFRQWVSAMLDAPRRICVIAGATGSGKSDVLSALHERGEQVLDLEALARHKGSVFGRIGEVEPQPSSEHFRNLVAEAWAKLDSQRFAFVEDEGDTIGAVALPQPTYIHLRKGAELIVRLDVPFALRANRSLATYGNFGIEPLIEAVAKFRRSMGSERTQRLLDLLEVGDLRTVCEEVLRTYDRQYAHKLMRGRDASRVVDVEVDSLNATLVAEQVLEAVAAASKH